MAGYLRHTFIALRQSHRSLATVTKSELGSELASSSTTVAPTKPTELGGPLRPHLRIPVTPNHGLYGFFRVKTDQNSHTKPSGSGQKEYVALEPPIPPTLRPSGRAWEATELRRKSFKDLHTLWYILLRERNLLATQAAERRRIQATADPNSSVKAQSCRKSMARIKAVISERRHAYKQALRLRRALRRDPESAGKIEDDTVDSMLEDDGEEKPTDTKIS